MLEDPYDRIRKFRRLLDRTVNKYAHEVDILTADFKDYKNAKLEFKDSKKEYIYTIDLREALKESIKINYEANVIEIVAKKQDRKTRPDKKTGKEEFSGYFRRIILPRDADMRSIDARFENGILVLKIKRTTKNSLDFGEISID